MKRILSFCALLCYSCALMAEEGLKLLPVEGAEQMFLLSRIGNVQFRSDTLYLYAADGSLLGESYVADIRKVVFADVPAAADVAQAEVLRVYPNPTMDRLIVSGAHNAAVARVFSLDGRLMLTQPLSGDVAAVEVGQLPAGTWLLQLNTSVIKFVKQ